LHDLNSNLKEPRILVNNLLQLRLDAAARTTTRFVVNSTLGIGGLVDVAGRNGIAQQSGDFGQTLFVWGVSEGPYVMSPFMGPATTRDAVGSVVDMAANPLGWLVRRWQPPSSKVPARLLTSIASAQWIKTET